MQLLDVDYQALRQALEDAGLDLRCPGPRVRHLVQCCLGGAAPCLLRRPIRGAHGGAHVLLRDGDDAQSEERRHAVAMALEEAQRAFPQLVPLGVLRHRVEHER